MKSLLALDLGTTTGFVAGTVDHHVSGIWQLKPTRFESAGMRFVKFRQKLVDLSAHYDIGFVVYEEVQRHVATYAAHVYGGLLGQLQVWCEEQRINYQGVGVGTIKKFATGKGNAKKDAMIAAVRDRWKYETDDDNEADAIALFRLKWDECPNGFAAPAAVHVLERGVAA